MIKNNKENKLIICFDDKAKNKNPITLENPTEVELKTLNEQGYGIFETANSFDATPEQLKDLALQKGKTILTKRNKEFLTSLDEVFSDLDICKDQDSLPEEERENRKTQLKKAIDMYCPASRYVITKNGLQPRWCIEETNISEETQQKYVNITNGIIEWSKQNGAMGDPVKDVTRVLRKPGYYHQKSKPYLVTEETGNGKIYTLDELKNYFWYEQEIKINNPVEINNGDTYSQIDSLDIHQIVIDVWKERGNKAGFDKDNHLLIDNTLTATFIGRQGKGNYVATSSSDYPAKGNAITYVAETLSISNKEAFKWLCEKYKIKNFKKELKGKAIVKCFADIQSVPISWLWTGRIALGKLTMIAGDPGLGKSLITATLAAHVSKGYAWPVDQSIPPIGDVILISAEDDPADTIKPRLEAAGADCNLIHVVEAIQDEVLNTEGKPTQHMFSFKRDIATLGDLLSTLPDCRLVIIDPISAYLDSADSNNNSDIRGLLAPLSELASKHKVAIVLVSHLNKNSGGNASYRVMGSLAFTAAVRTAYIVTQDKDNPKRRLLMPLKNNIAKDKTGLAYSIVGVENEQPVIAWESEPVEITTEEALAISQSTEQHTANDEAVDFLIDILANGPIKADEAIKEAQKISIGTKPLRNARAKLGIKPKKSSTFENSFWMWELPEGAQTTEGAQSKREGALEQARHLGNTSKSKLDIFADSIKLDRDKDGIEIPLTLRDKDNIDNLPNLPEQPPKQEDMPF